MRIRRKDEEASEDLVELLSQAITEDIAKWHKQWDGGYELSFEAKADIYNVVLERFRKGIEI